MFATIIVIVMVIASIASFALLSSNRSMTRELAELRLKAGKSDEVIANLEKNANAERSRLNLQITSLKLRQANLIASFEQEKDELISNAVNELNQRSEQIDKMMQKIGIKVSSSSTKEAMPNSGGPFIELHPGLQDELLDKTDLFLETIKSVPLGKPVKNQITSRFGPRKDPVNHKRGFHEGIDFKGKTGDNIYVTGAGVVTKAFRNGSYGNFIEIDHKNGYKTTYAHLKKFTVAVGDKVKRGQLIGQIGNTGRSTGPHLHYELLYRGKPVNPLKFMQVAKLLEPESSTK